MKRTIIVFSILAIVFWSCHHQGSEQSEHTHIESEKLGHKHADEKQAHSQAIEHEHEHNEAGTSDLSHDVEESNEHTTDGNKVIFYKGHAENIEFEVQPLVVKPFSEIIHASGQLLSAQGDNSILTSNNSGKFHFNTTTITPGKHISQGEIVGYVSGNNLINNNTSHQFTNARLEYNKAEADLNRAEQLIKDTIISQEEFQRYKLIYEQAKARYNVIAKAYSESGIKIVASKSGFIKNVFVMDGEYVTTGASLLELAENKRLLLRADISQKYADRLNSVSSVNFKTNSSEKVYESDNLNGKLISYSRSTTNEFLLPVYFEIDNDKSLIPGSFIEVWLKIKHVEESILVPVSALLEEQGTYFVFIQTDSETYERRDVIIGKSDGKFTQVKSGLKGNEKVVSRGAIRIKLASLSASLPSSGHAH